MGAMFIAPEQPKRFALRQECHVRAGMIEMSVAAATCINHIALLTECETRAALNK
jgi:hypothetical protein